MYKYITLPWTDSSSPSLPCSSSPSLSAGSPYKLRLLTLYTYNATVVVRYTTYLSIVSFQSDVVQQVHREQLQKNIKNERSTNSNTKFILGPKMNMHYKNTDRYTAIKDTR